MNISNYDLVSLGNKILTYCEKFNIPLDYLFEILEDQKVTPMIRGKAMEYNAYLLLDSILPKTIWSVQKLNLNAQTGLNDEDISITHRRTGVILKIECKSAVRGSFKVGSKRTKVPYFSVKCHRSRSNIKLAATSNDRYSTDSFDLIITNVSNSIFQGNTVGESLEVLHDDAKRQYLLNYYKKVIDKDLIKACEQDWRFVIPKSISVDGYIPRTPIVKLENDENWKKLDNLSELLLEVVEEKRKSSLSSRRS